MRIPFLASVLLFAACENRPSAPPVAGNEAGANAGAPVADPALAAAGARWDLQYDGEAPRLALLSNVGKAELLLLCPGGQQLLVNVPAFRPIGSEERLSFGGGGDAVALVADTAGDKARGGVSGAGAVPAELARILDGPVSASYGAQKSGPHSAPPPELADRFVYSCGRQAAASSQAAGACMMQDGKALAAAPLRAIGTEPFWGARIEGRCVTYSHPENQKGTRVWTRYTPGAEGGGTWAGRLENRPFELRVTRKPSCSDGMSDKVYPFAVALALGADRRTGCAEPS